MSVWRKCKRYKNYEVNDAGNVRNTKTGHVLKPTVNNFGYEIVVLCEDGKKQTEKVHRLVAEAFISRNQNETQVNHLDGCKHNNRVDNLEWCTCSENLRHAFDNGLCSNTRKVRVVETGEVFNSLADCARTINGNHENISACLNGKRKTHKGLHFEEV